MGNMVALVHKSRYDHYISSFLSVFAGMLSNIPTGTLMKTIRQLNAEFNKNNKDTFTVVNKNTPLGHHFNKYKIMENIELLPYLRQGHISFAPDYKDITRGWINENQIRHAMVHGDLKMGDLPDSWCVFHELTPGIWLIIKLQGENDYCTVNSIHFEDDNFNEIDAYDLMVNRKKFKTQEKPIIDDKPKRRGRGPNINPLKRVQSTPKPPKRIKNCNEQRYKYEKRTDLTKEEKDQILAEYAAERIKLKEWREQLIHSKIARNDEEYKEYEREILRVRAIGLSIYQLKDNVEPNNIITSVIEIPKNAP